MNKTVIETELPAVKRAGLMQKVAGFFTELMRRYLPDPFVFAIVLTFLTVILAIVVEQQSFTDVTAAWGKGFWSLLAFTTQMAVVLANAPAVDRLMDAIASRVETPRTAAIVATLVGAVGSYLNWGFGLVIGGIIAKKLALHVKNVHYPLIIAAAYSGFTMYGLGLSATIPMVISTPGHPMEKQMGLITLAETIFSAPMLITAAVVLVTLLLLNGMLHPKPGQPVTEIDRALHAAAPVKTEAVDLDANTFASKLNNSRILAVGIGALGMAYVLINFIRGGGVDLNLINFFILFLGLLLLGTPNAYLRQLNEGIKTISGIILQFPFYAGIMAIMGASGLVLTISGIFTSISTPETLPFWGLVSSFLINFFAPSGGGHWVIQGPFMIDAAKAIGASPAQTAMSVMLGNAWNDLVQPFWILPALALALSKLKLKDIMGYTVVMVIWVGIIYIAAVLPWGFLG